MSSLPLYRIDERWLKQMHISAVDAIDMLNDDCGYHAGGLESLVPLVPVVELDPVTRWCFAHQDEVFTEVGTDKLICSRHLRSPCDIDDAAVVRIGGET